MRNFHQLHNITFLSQMFLFFDIMPLQLLLLLLNLLLLMLSQIIDSSLVFINDI